MSRPSPAAQKSTGCNCRCCFFSNCSRCCCWSSPPPGRNGNCRNPARPLIVVLDDSFSMRAMEGGVSAQTRARDFLETLFRRQPPPSTRLILAGTEPRSLGSTAKNWREVNALLPQWKCWSPDAAIDSAITLAVELGKQQANILVLTDHKPAGEKITSPAARMARVRRAAGQFCHRQRLAHRVRRPGPLPARSRQFFRRRAHDQIACANRHQCAAKLAHPAWRT